MAGKEVSVKKTRVLGCSTKWAYKAESVKRKQEAWDKREVKLDEIGEEGIKKLLKNDTKKLRLINLWATWCTTCVAEMPDLVTLRRRFSHRQVEVVTISIDKSSQKKRVLKVLKNNSAAVPANIERTLKAEGRSTNNYISTIEDTDKLAEALDPKWQGPMPHSLLIAPGGKILWRHTGGIDFMELHEEIIKFRGRLFEWW